MTTQTQTEQQRLDSIYNSIQQKLAELHVSGDEATQVFSRAIIASAIATESSSMSIQYGNGLSVSVNIPDSMLAFHQNSSSSNVFAADNGLVH